MEEFNALNRLDELLQSKDFKDLDPDEKKWIEEELGGEEAYMKLRSIVNASASEPEMSVSGSVKQSLMTAMKRKNQPQWAKLINFQIPAYVGALILFISIVFVILAEPQTQVVEKIVEVPSDPVIDTVFVQTKADTVFIDRIKEVPVYLTVEETPEQVTPEEPIPPLTSKSLADQEEIRKLIVRMDDD